MQTSQAILAAVLIWMPCAHGAPTITCKNDTTVEAGESYVLDIYEGNVVGVNVTSAGLTGDDILPQTVKFRSVALLNVVYSATDGNGAVTCSQKINVTDTTPPTLTCQANAQIQIGDTINIEATAEDNADGFTSAHVTRTPGGLSANHTFSIVEVVNVTYTATDDAGYSATCSQIVTVVDDTDPVITCNNDTTIEIGTPAIPVEEASKSDNSGTVEVTKSPTDLTNPHTFNSVEKVTVTFTATDPSGNTATCEQDINVVDTTKPVITCSDDIEFFVGTTSTVMEKTVSDNSASAPTVTKVPDYATNYTFDTAGVVTVVFTATDDSQNSASCNQTFTVKARSSPDPESTDESSTDEVEDCVDKIPGGGLPGISIFTGLLCQGIVAIGLPLP